MTRRLASLRPPPRDWFVSFDGETVGFQGQTKDPCEIDKLIETLKVQRNLLASGIEAGTDETLQAAQPGGQEPGAKGRRPMAIEGVDHRMPVLEGDGGHG